MTINGARILLPTVYNCLIFAILLPLFSTADDILLPLDVKSKCPGAEDAITKAVTNAVAGNKGLCAGVLRLHFHDCFVRGCDASVLLDNSTANPNPEKDSIPNKTLRGFQVIDAAKIAVEAYCAKNKSCPTNGCDPVVSCADVLAFAARDCVKILGDFFYDVYSGRPDGTISIAQEAVDNLPAPFFNITQLQSSFAKKNLTLEDLTVLSGAHSVGVAHCSSFEDRLTSINSSQINVAFANSLKQKCTNGNVTVPQDYVTPDYLDNQYFINNLNNTVLFFSDFALRTNTITEDYMEQFGNNYKLSNPNTWKDKFKCAMQKMGRIIELGPNQGEIRKVCSAINVS
ncbi:Peroxidase [Rhynchospora pubera]|uniref:Peroxidase n=1 Tax=Rhynchospora pubera TaxID=906938 RepID=A0AAV8FI05_9POAL|nr:Peroxidase [Rhynchospora pubera]